VKKRSTPQEEKSGAETAEASKGAAPKPPVQAQSRSQYPNDYDEIMSGWENINTEQLQNRPDFHASSLATHDSETRDKIHLIEHSPRMNMNQSGVDDMVNVSPLVSWSKEQETTKSTGPSAEKHIIQVSSEASSHEEPGAADETSLYFQRIMHPMIPPLSLLISKDMQRLKASRLSRTHSIEIHSVDTSERLDMLQGQFTLDNLGGASLLIAGIYMALKSSHRTAWVRIFHCKDPDTLATMGVTSERIVVDRLSALLGEPVTIGILRHSPHSPLHIRFQEYSGIYDLRKRLVAPSVGAATSRPCLLTIVLDFDSVFTEDNFRNDFMEMMSSESTCNSSGQSSPSAESSDEPDSLLPISLQPQENDAAARETDSSSSAHHQGSPSSTALAMWSRRIQSSGLWLQGCLTAARMAGNMSVKRCLELGLTHGSAHSALDQVLDALRKQHPAPQAIHAGVLFVCQDSGPKCETHHQISWIERIEKCVLLSEIELVALPHLGEL